ncbi:MAG: ribulose-phosphate 3-epimerase [Bacteroidales bacterium]|nr:ribulose-phosphate 3-epimerase [Bacteroidales bacterium]
MIMIVSPSLLSADFSNLAKDVAIVDKSKAEYIHVDVMDGVFVPNITFAFPVMKSVDKLSDKIMDVHLMIVEPQKFISEVKKCGGDIMTVHYEACTHLHRVIQQIKDAGMKAGAAINPSTPVNLLSEVIADLDLVCIMSVNPGFAAQKFIANSVNKIKELKQLIKEKGSHALIEVDGGINLETGKLVAEAGADVVVAGSFVFGSSDPVETIAQLQAL